MTLTEAAPDSLRDRQRGRGVWNFYGDTQPLQSLSVGTSSRPVGITADPGWRSLFRLLSAFYPYLHERHLSSVGSRAFLDGMYKNQLQELAQRSCFNLPSYSCIREGPDHAPRFKASVNFNGEVFESPTFCTTLRQAEHAAAEVALNTLSRKGPISLAARVLDETGVYRNLLQETAHRAGLNLPVYTTVRSGPGHMPIFTCTVALAGMSFTGDSARNKKQAQKNAALAAWSALKQLPHAGMSASSSPSLDSESNEEQVTIACILASLKPPDGNRPQSQNDVQRGRRKSMSCLREKNSSSIVSMHTMQYQRWSHPSFSPEVAVYQLWQQQQQSHFLALPRPASVTKPRFLSFTESGSPSNDANSHFCPSIDQELGSCTPSPFYSSTQTIGVAVRNNSRDTILETHEENQMEDKLRACGGFREDETVSTGQNNNFSSRTREFHSSTVQGGYVPNGSAEPKTLEAADESRKDDSSDIYLGTARFRSGTSDSCQSTILRTCFNNDMHVHPESWDIHREHSQKEQLDRGHNDSTDSSLIPQDTQSARFRPKRLDVKSPSHGPRPFDSWSSRPGPCQTGQFGPSAGMRSFRRPYAMAAPVTIRSAIPVYAAKPRMDSLANHIPSSNFMAPAVQVRHVMPIHSAALVNKLPKPNNEPLHSDEKRSAEPRGVAAVISALGKLEI